MFACDQTQRFPIAHHHQHPSSEAAHYQDMLVVAVRPAGCFTTSWQASSERRRVVPLGDTRAQGPSNGQQIYDLHRVINAPMTRPVRASCSNEYSSSEHCKCIWRCTKVAMMRLRQDDRHAGQTIPAACLDRKLLRRLDDEALSSKHAKFAHTRFMATAARPQTRWFS